MKKLTLACVILSHCVVLGCGRNNASRVFDDAKVENSSPEKLRRLRELKLQILLNAEISNILETSFAIQQLEQRANVTLSTKVFETQTPLSEKEIALQRSLHDVKSPAGALSCGGGVLLLHWATDIFQNPRATEKMIKKANRMTSSALILSLSGVLLSINSMKVKSLASPLPAHERRALESQIESDSDKEVSVISTFLKLGSAEDRDFRSALVKEAVDVYDALAQQYVLIEVENFQEKFQKKFDFFKVAREFSPDRNDVEYKQRLKFLEAVFKDLQVVQQNASDEKVTVLQYLGLSLEVMKGYRDALKKVDQTKIESYKKDYDKTVKLVDDRITALEEMEKLAR